jgi:hypothetical protein
MSDIVNDFFRNHYPSDWDTSWEMRSLGAGGYGREYNGDRETNSRIFPEMVCTDGFRMSVQGHYGAYSYPRDDFADSYFQVEIMCKPEARFEVLGRGYDVGDARIYPYVPVKVVIEVIGGHGGLALPSTHAEGE